MFFALSVLLFLLNLVGYSVFPRLLVYGVLSEGFQYIKNNDIEQGKYDKFFNNILEEYDLDDVVTILHYVIKSVKSRDFRDENGKKINNK